MTAPISGPRPLVWFIPERPGRMVTMHACWGADFNGKTAVFPTEAEAVDFCLKLWRREPRVDRRGADSANKET